MKACLRLSLLVFLVHVGASNAVIETYEFSSPLLEERYHQLSQELRCPKCQNQNIADSNAPISQDLRRLVYAQLEAGQSNDEILDSLVARYGEFVRYRPSAAGPALWLWLAPVLLLLVGFAALFIFVRRGGDRDLSSVAPVSDAERRKIDALLQGTGQRSGMESDA